MAIRAMGVHKVRKFCEVNDVLGRHIQVLPTRPGPRADKQGPSTMAPCLADSASLMLRVRFTETS
jgi:hypothetical protein